MDKLISRQAAIDSLNDEFTIIGKTNAIAVQDYIRRVNNRLRDLPSAQQWIPVTERLPEPNQLVGKTRKYYLIQNEYGDMLTASYNKTVLGFIYWEQMYDIEPLHDKVIAWMPLPEPYRKEIEDGEIHGCGCLD